MDQPCRSFCSTKHTTCARQEEKKQCSTILERWYKDDLYRGSLSKHGRNEETLMEYDNIALEDHSCTATSEERRRNENSWKLSLNAECKWNNGSARRLLKMQKRDAKDRTMSVQQLPDETHLFLHSNKSDRGPTSSSKATSNIRLDLIHLDGNIIFPPQCIRPSSSSRWQTSNWSSTWNWDSWDS